MTLPNDLDAFWLPFTDNRGFKTHPRMLARAQDMTYWTPDGREVLDGTAGLWCVNAGHNRPRIVEAIREQAGVMDYAPTCQLGHPLAFELATRLAGIRPTGSTGCSSPTRARNRSIPRSRSRWPTRGPSGRARGRG